MYHWKKRLRMRGILLTPLTLKNGVHIYFLNILTFKYTAHAIGTRDLITSEDILLFDADMSITNSNSEIFGSENSNSGIGRRKDACLPLFSFASVSLATDNFSIENKLGEGGFGPVYKVSSKNMLRSQV